MVSIIIPAYNTGKYLCECLDSVLRQTWRDMEVIVVNDGSTDATEEIARGYAARDGRVKLITVSNGGQAAARNIGLDRAEGEWIAFVDSDDILYPRAIESLMGIALRSGAPIACGRFVEGRRWVGERYGRDGSNRRDRSNRGHGNHGDAEIPFELLTAEEFMERMLYQSGADSSVCCKLYARRLFEKQRFVPGILYEDLDIACRLAAEGGSVAVSEEVVYFYRENLESSTHRFTPRRLDVLDVTARIEEYVARNYPRLLLAARDRRLSASFNMLGLIVANDAEEEYRDAAMQCRDIIRRYRHGSLLNPRVRLKNKLGILASYFGQQFLDAILRRVY